MSNPRPEICPGCLLQVAQEPPSEAEADAATEAFASRAGFSPPAPSELSDRLTGLQILDLIGHGGMGAVYTARQRELNRIVAVKVLPKEIQDDPGFGDRFLREAQTLAKLNHPNIVTVYDIGRAGDLFYFIMEYVDGITLRDAISAGGLTPEEALRIVPQLCEALQYAHEEGVVHRDIKPENILLDRRGQIKIADFGLAKLLHSGDHARNLTHTHQVMGTANYMAPEQMTTSKNVDHRADIFSLGVVFYELLTGEIPKGWFAPPSKKVAVDVRIDDVVLRALESEPEKRYQRASDVKTDVEKLALDAIVSQQADDKNRSDEIRLHKILDETK
ncbi:MAG: serine/threonine protein kinase, partial [Planctomycetales bacterium]|nr:serine/threonine protein kinase [Planctomycetales bacterium]